MSRRLVPVVLVLFALTARADHGRLLRHANAVPNRYLVIFNDSATNHPNVAGLAHELAGRFGATIPRSRYGEELFQWTIKGFVAEMSGAAATAMADDTRVDFIEQDAEAHVSASPRSLSEISFSSLDNTTPQPTNQRWSLDRIDESQAVWDGTTYHGDKTYSYATDGAGVYIYMLDTGVQRSHWEFNGSTQVKDGVEFSDDPGGNYQAYAPCGTEDKNEWQSIAPHGTATASVAAGASTGVASGAYIVPIKVVKCDGTVRLSWLCLGMDWIVSTSNPYRYDALRNPMPGVVSTSLFFDAGMWTSDQTDTTGGAFGQSTQDVIRGCALADAPCPAQRGFAVIASANNQYSEDGACSQWPAQLSYNGLKDGGGNYLVGYPDYRVITVGGTDEQDRVWDTRLFTREGSGDFLGSNYGRCVDIYAPAHNVKSAAMRGSTTYTDYEYNTGTSFSAPYVAGIAARLLQSSPNMSPADVWAAISSRAQSRTETLTRTDYTTTTITFLIAHMGPSE